MCLFLKKDRLFVSGKTGKKDRLFCLLGNREKKMELLSGNIKKIYFKYFAATFGCSCISCIYGIVDMAVVGQYHGPDGTAAMSVVMPVFNIIYALGLLFGIGGSVLYSLEKGHDAGKNPDENPQAKADPDNLQTGAGPDNTQAGADSGGKTGGSPGCQDEYFTVACAAAVIFSLLLWIILFAFDEELLYLFGADDDLIVLAMQYMAPLRYGAPVFLFVELIGAFLRNDNAPGLATAAVIGSGIFNVFGDIFLVFGLDLGIMGAGIATCIGGGVSLLIMTAHFFSKKNSLRFVKIKGFARKFAQIVKNGFSTFFADLSLGIVTVLFNRQIMTFLGSNALSVFGILMNLNTFVMCCGYSIGQSAQPIISTNLGAGKTDRIHTTTRCAIATTAVFGIMWIAIIFSVPELLVKLFMSPTEEVLQMAPSIMRTYGIAFLFMPFNVFSTYYFQSILRPATAMAISLARGLFLSGALIMLLPVLFGANAIWLAMPTTEIAVAIYAAGAMTRAERGKRRRVSF